jgi:hypothetical protein
MHGVVPNGAATPYARDDFGCIVANIGTGNGPRDVSRRSLAAPFKPRARIRAQFITFVK